MIAYKTRVKHQEGHFDPTLDNIFEVGYVAIIVQTPGCTGATTNKGN